MADSRDPIKTPVVHIFNSSGEEIINSLGINGLSVVELKYNFDDEDDDECSIKLRANNPSVLDGTTIKYGSRLIVQWGYIGGPLSSKAVVVVRDIQTKYGNNVILGTGTDFQLFLYQMALGNIYYDPGIKLENISTNSKIKKRSQFRIKSKFLPNLYKINEIINVIE